MSTDTDRRRRRSAPETPTRRRSGTAPRWPTGSSGAGRTAGRPTGTFHAPNPAGPLADPDAPAPGAPKLYVLDMFPYPSGAGLHVGHPLGYIGTDCYARYQRMAGCNVLHAMGFDAFGLPAEQYAVQTGTHPRTTTEANVERYRAQLRRLGLALRRPPLGGHHRRRVLPLDAVDLPADLQLLVRRGRSARPGRSPS